jgi:Predicted nucleoside-diphosphate-sugar epimerases
MSMRVLLLGANGFIGSSILLRLMSSGHAVTGLARHPNRAACKWPGAGWIKSDLSKMLYSDDWRSLVEDHDVIVNCAGVLQDGLSDDLAATQEQSMRALYERASSAGNKRIVQISASDNRRSGHLPFMATKRRADDALATSGVECFILRPALVLGRNAHGGSALIRALASTPFAVPLLHADSSVQTVAVDDVADIVAMAVEGALPGGTDIELAAPERLTLGQLVQLHRQWLGLPSARVVQVPSWFGSMISRFADLAGRLGWRSPLRSTALAVMEHGVTTQFELPDLPAGLALRTAQQALGANPSGVQDLWFARLYLLKPVVIVSISAFWFLSGTVPLADPSRAAAHFEPFMTPSLALALTHATCAIDIALGLFILIRPFTKKALITMLVVAFSYLLGGTLLKPDLWLDPLGPLVKVLPFLSLCVLARAILDER